MRTVMLMLGAAAMIAGALPVEAKERGERKERRHATEGEGRRTFALAQVGQVGIVEPEGPGYAVRGEVLLRQGWRDAGERRGFRCSADAQAVRSVRIDGLAMLPPR